MRRLLSVLLLLCAVPTDAATRDVAGCSVALVQAGIDAAASGDTVRLQASCSATWSTQVTIPSTKGITLDGNGSAITRGMASNTYVLWVVANATTGTRITRFTFTDSQAFNYGFINIDGTITDAKFRIDHCAFIGDDLLTHIGIWGTYGLIDHNTFTWYGNNEIIHNNGYGADSADAGWSTDVHPGSDEAVYVEDNTFTNQVTGNPAYFHGGSAVQMYYGARTVFRHNVCNDCQFDCHGTSQESGDLRGGRWWEVYDNQFVNASDNSNQDKYIDLRGGSGVVFNNTHSGTNTREGSISLREESAVSYPARDQIGRGKNQALDPAYVWNNDAIMAVYGDSLVVLDRDFYASSKPGYAAYTYPHPLQGVTPPNAPTNVRIR